LLYWLLVAGGASYSRLAPFASVTTERLLYVPISTAALDASTWLRIALRYSPNTEDHLRRESNSLPWVRCPSCCARVPNISVFALHHLTNQLRKWPSVLPLLLPGKGFRALTNRKQKPCAHSA